MFLRNPLFEIVEYHQTFGELGIARLIALIDPGNLPSARVAEKIGMRFEKQARNRHRSFWIYSSEK